MKFDQILWYTLDLDIEGSEKLDGMNKNWGRWSDKVDLKFSQRASFDAWLENILSISVLKWPVTLFGCKMYYYYYYYYCQFILCWRV